MSLPSPVLALLFFWVVYPTPVCHLYASCDAMDLQVALGFTYKASKSDGRWRASTIKGGWAEQSGMVKSGDVIVSVGGTQCTGLDFKAVTSLLQV